MNVTTRHARDDYEKILLIDNDSRITEMLSICTHTVVIKSIH